MNDEQNNTDNNSETTGNTGKSSVTPDTNLQSQPVTGNDNAGEQDDYYAVDHAKKDVISTIGDGEMHDEGLVGEGETTTTDLQSSTKRLSDEQDTAELHDSEG